jgi:hypothetical protein
MSPIYYHLPVMLVIISLIYSGTRYDSWPAILLEAARWGLRMIGFLVGIGIVLYVLWNVIPSYRGFLPG